MKTMHNLITDEIRAIRHELAGRFHNDLDRIIADLQKQQRESGRQYIQLPSDRSARIIGRRTRTTLDGGRRNPRRRKHDAVFRTHAALVEAWDGYFGAEG